MKLMALDVSRFLLLCILTNKGEEAWKERGAEGVKQQFFHVTAPFAKPVDLILSSGGHYSSPRASPVGEQPRQIQHLSEALFDRMPSCAFLTAIWPIIIYCIINIWCRIPLQGCRVSG